MPLNIDWKQILLHLFNLVLLFCILFFLLYKPVKKFMDKRMEGYRKTEEDTLKRNEEAEKNRQLYLEKLQNVEKEIATLKEQATQNATLESDKLLENARKEGETIVAEAKAQGEEERKKIVAESKEDILETVSAVCEKMMIQADVPSAYDSFLKEVNGDNDGKNGDKDE